MRCIQSPVQAMMEPEKKIRLSRWERARRSALPAATAPIPAQPPPARPSAAEVFQWQLEQLGAQVEHLFQLGQQEELVEHLFQ
jgi:hypothetical protein